MPDLNLVFSRRQIRNRKLPILVGNRVVRIVHDHHVRLHPAVDRTLDVQTACLLDLALIHLALNRLRNVEEAIITLKELNVVQYRITVPQRDLGIHGHDLNMR